MLWIKAFHIIMVVCWFAMLFYLPRLFVYHAMAEDEISKKRFQVMERKLYWGIGTPSMIAALILGITLVGLRAEYYMTSAWFHMKIVGVIILVAYHIACGIYVKKFQRESIGKSHIYFRWFNEFPVLLLTAIVVLVVVQQPL